VASLVASLLALCLAQDPGGLRKETLLQVIEGLQAPLEDFSCEFEGKAYFLGGRKSDDTGERLFDVYCGRFIYSGERMFTDIFHRFYPEQELYRETIATNGDKTELYTRAVDRPGAGGQVAKTTYEEYDRRGCMGRIFLLPALKAWLRYDNAEMRDLGDEDIGGRECRVVEFYFKESPEGPQYRFWLDLHRHGYPVKKCILRDGIPTLIHRIDGFQEVKVASGGTAFIPLSGVVEQYGMPDEDGVVRDPGKVRYKEHIAVNLPTLQVNRHPSDAEFAVKFRVGTPITDKLKSLEYEFGKDHRPPPQTRADAEERLKELLKEAEAQGDELKAPAWSRNGDFDPLGWAPWIIAALTTSSLVVLLIRRRLAAGS
jgi:hypothetical protein